MTFCADHHHLLRTLSHLPPSAAVQLLGLALGIPYLRSSLLPLTGPRATDTPTDFVPLGLNQKDLSADASVCFLQDRYGSACVTRLKNPVLETLSLASTEASVSMGPDAPMGLAVCA